MADSEKYFTKTVDGQLSVATVAQSGEIIPEESRPGDKYTTALVQTSDGPQLCVKTFDLNGGGGGGGTVDQTYNPTSTNAQSGTAVAEAVQPALKNTATATKALTILGYDSTEEAATNIGDQSQAKKNSLAVGKSAKANAQSAVAIGYFSAIYSDLAVAVGPLANVQSNCRNSIQLGQGTNGSANTFQVYSYTMLDGTTGKIPMARLPIVQCTQAEYDALVSGGTVDANTIYCIIPA